MRKIPLYILGISALLTGCNQEPLPAENELATKTPTSIGQQLSGPKIVLGKLHIKLNSEVADRMPQDIRLAGQSIRMNSLPSPMTTILNSIQATRLERLFTIDPRFEKRMRREGLDRWFVVSFDESQDVFQTLATLKKHSQVEIAEEVFTLSRPLTKAIPALSTKAGNENDMPFDDPLLPNQWHYHNTGTLPGAETGADINLFKAWEQTTGDAHVIVSIVDGGIDVTHEDLKDNLWINTGEIPNNGIDDDGNGMTDDVNGYNFADMQGPITVDNEGHGTHVAGTVAACNNNGIGVAGVAGGNGSPGSGAKLMSCQIFGMHTDGNSADAIRYGADNGAVISQNSWGYDYPGPSSLPSSIKAAIDYFIKYAGCDNDGNQLPDSPMKGGVVIFAAGNDGQDFLAYPGAYEATISVSAMAPNWEKAYYTNRGEWVDIMAPGGDEYFGTTGLVLSTVPSSIYGTNYAYMQGTSMACPHVSGIAALIVAKMGKQGFTNEELKERLLNSLRPENIDLHNPGYEGRLGIGYIDAAQTLAENRQKSPDKITDLTADATFTDVIIKWSAVADEDDGMPVSYTVYFSDSPLTAQNLHEATSYQINAYGYQPGTEMTYSINRLKENTTYYTAVTSADRWGLTADPAIISFSTLTNNPPVISNLPEMPVRVALGETARFSVTLSDPDGHTVSHRFEGDTKGVSATRDDDELSITIRPVLDEGTYTFSLIAADELGMESKADISFEIYEKEAPSVLNQLPDLLMDSKDSPKETDLTQYFTGTELSYEVQSTDETVAIPTINGTTLVVTPGQAGQATITVTASNGDEQISSSFSVRVVGGSDELVYEVYPQPASTELNILLNPKVSRASISIRTLFGEEVFSQNYNVIRLTPITLDIHGLAAGAYTLQVETAQETYKKTFVKQ